MLETKMFVHGYLGNKASKEMEQFFSHGELKSIAHYENGIWIAPTCSTFKSYLPDIFPESRGRPIYLLKANRYRYRYIGIGILDIGIGIIGIGIGYEK